MDAALQNIPTEIEDDLRAVRQSMDDYIDVLEANDWDFFAASSAIEEIEGPELEAAEARLETWEVANCGFPEDGDDFEDALDEDPFSAPEAFEAMLSSDAGRAMIIEGMTEDGELTADQAECMLDNSGFEMLSTLATGAELGPESLTPFFEMAVLCDLEETSIFGDEDWSEDLDDADVDLTPELVEAMLETEAGRAMFIEGMTEDGTTHRRSSRMHARQPRLRRSSERGRDPEIQRLVQRRRTTGPRPGFLGSNAAPSQADHAHELLSSRAPYGI